MCDETISEYLTRTYDPSPLKRKQALKDLCPCHVRADIPELWERIFQLLSDEDGVCVFACNVYVCGGLEGSSHSAPLPQA